MKLLTSSKAPNLKNSNYRAENTSDHKNDKNNTPTKSKIELEIYFNKNVFFNREK